MKHLVKGHYRKINGKKVWVKAHTKTKTTHTKSKVTKESYRISIDGEVMKGTYKSFDEAVDEAKDLAMDYAEGDYDSIIESGDGRTFIANGSKIVIIGK